MILNKAINPNFVFMSGNPVILFDGVCNFCNNAINFTLKRNTKANIRFAPMQSEAGQKLLQQYNGKNNRVKQIKTPKKINTI